MHIYHFSILKTESSSLKHEGWIKDCYRRFNKSDIKELFIVRQHKIPGRRLWIMRS